MQIRNDYMLDLRWLHDASVVPRYEDLHDGELQCDVMTDPQSSSGEAAEAPPLL